MAIKWTVKRDQKEHAPVSSEQLRNLARAGKLKPTDLVRRGETGDWKKASSVAGLLAPGDVSRETAAAGPASEPAASPSPDGSLPMGKLLATIAGGAVLIALLLPAVQRAREAGRKAGQRGLQAGQHAGQGTISRLDDPERTEEITDTWTRSESDSKGVAASSTVNQSAKASTKPVKVGTLEEMGARAFENLPFAEIDGAQEIQDVPLTEDFAKPGVFAFRRIVPDGLKATLSRQKWEQMTALGYNERTEVQELNESFDIRKSEGEPRSMIEWKSWPGLVHTYPILRLGARPGDRWEWTNPDASGNEMVSRYVYQRCVQHNGVRCVLIESELSISGRKSARKLRWYAEGIGLVKQVDYILLPDYTMESTMHRIIRD